MKAIDFNRIADKFYAKMKRKKMIKTERRTSKFLKTILKFVKKRAKKGYYFVDISKDIDYIDYAVIYEKLEHLSFIIDRSYNFVFRIKW